MKLPFTVKQFFAVFRDYNDHVWPTQIILFSLALLIIFLILAKRNSDKIITLILSSLWLWMGIVYHLIFFTGINKAAYFFGALFIIQGLLFFVTGVVKNEISFRFKLGISGISGAALIVYALILYPLIGYLLGHRSPYSPTFGLPCPTTIFTFGILLWTHQKNAITLLIIPFIWSLIGFSAALFLGIYEDTGLLVAGLLVAITITTMRNKRKLREAHKVKVIV